MNITRRDIGVIAICLVVFIAFIVFGCVLISNKENKDVELVFAPVEHLEVTFSQPYKGTYSFSEETFSAGTGYNTSSNFTASKASVREVMITASGANAELFNYSSSYFHVSYGYTSISPILPLAIANVETPGRADFDITWSALFPSKIVPVSEMNTFDVTSVVSNESYYNALSKEYSTRDRGCLQMSPTYGTSNKTLNQRMSGTEKDKLETVDTSNYSSWVKGASDLPGDRFYLPDVLLRMSAAMQVQCDNIAKNNYQPDNDFQLIAMLAMGHQSSGIWSFNNHSKSVGCWKSGDKALEWAKLVGSKEMVDVLTQYAEKSSATYIDTNTAKKLFSKISNVPTNTYATKDIVCYYPIKALYSYIKLCMLYTK